MGKNMRELELQLQLNHERQRLLDAQIRLMKYEERDIITLLETKAKENENENSNFSRVDFQESTER